MTKLLSLTIGVVFALTAQATTVVNTFDFGPNGQITSAANAISFGGSTTVSYLGVTFSYSSSGALYGDTINTTSNLLGPDFTDPVLDGPTPGTLTLTFASPSTSLSFDVLYVVGPDAGNSNGEVTINGSESPFTTTGNSGSNGFFSIGQFDSGTVAPFSSATIAFSDSSALAFAIDNLTYTTSSAAPEPPSFSLLLGGALVTGALFRARRSERRRCRSALRSRPVLGFSALSRSRNSSPALPSPGRA